MRTPYSGGESLSTTLTVIKGQASTQKHAYDISDDSNRAEVLAAACIDDDDVTQLLRLFK